MGRAILTQRGLDNERLVLGDAYKSGLPRGSFDLVHIRLLLINLQETERALTELTALARPGEIIAVQDIDQVPWLCEPSHPAWEALLSRFLMIWRANGLDPLIGHRLPALLRAAMTSQLAADALRQVFAQQIAPKLVAATPDHPVQRAGLTGAFVIGLAMTRYVLVNPPVANLSREELCRWAAPVIRQLLTGPAAP